MIPPDLKNFLSHPRTPWCLSPEVADRLQPTHPRYKTAVLLPTDLESQFVIQQFMNDKPPGLSISRITCVYNRALTELCKLD